jgi:hypothetical protein
VLNPLVGWRQQPDQFPPDIDVPSAGLPAADAAAKADLNWKWRWSEGGPEVEGKAERSGR